MNSGSSIHTLHLADYAELLRRRWLTISICLLIGLGAALAYLQWAPKQYRATASILVTPIADATPGATDKTSTNLDTEAQLVVSTETATAAADRLGLADSRGLASRVTVTVPPNTRILQIAYTGPTPRDAQRGSLAFAEAYLDQRRANAQSTLDAEDKALQARIDALNGQLQQATQAAAALSANSVGRTQLDAQVRALDDQLTQLGREQDQIHATVITPGSVSREPRLPSSPSSPVPLVTVSAGLFLGLLAGVALAALRQRGDLVLRDPQDVVRRTGLPVATVLSAALQPGEVTIRPPAAADGRGYARLRNLLTPVLGQTRRPVALVAGVRHGGGPVAANLAASLARTGQDVYLICADGAGDSATSLLGGRPRTGLAHLLAGEVDLAGAATSVPGVPRLRIVTWQKSGAAEELPPSRGLRAVIDEMVASGSSVVVEAPATSSAGSDAQTLASLASLAVLVVEAGKVAAPEVLDARAQFESVGTPVSAVVVVRYGRTKGAGPIRRTAGTPVPTASDGPASRQSENIAGSVGSPASPGGELVPPRSRSGVAR